MTNPAGAIRTEAERNLALLGYGLLAVSVFFAGVTALVAVVIAYALHDAATEQLSSHFRFQIRIFWIGAAAVALMVVAGLVAVLGAIGNLLHQDVAGYAMGEIDLWGHVIDLSHLKFTPLVLVSSAIAVGSALCGMLWITLAPAIGFIRLASSRHIGQTARP